MESFKIDNECEIICEWVKTRNAFKHTATLLKNGQEIDKTKICYQNRTWERYQFESVLSKMIEKNNIVPEDQRQALLDHFASNRKNPFDALQFVCAAGEILNDTQEEKNAWKKRMIQAQSAGITFPDNWDDLSESEKTSRLTAALKSLEA